VQTRTGSNISYMSSRPRKGGVFLIHPNPIMASYLLSHWVERPWAPCLPFAAQSYPSLHAKRPHSQQAAVVCHPKWWHFLTGGSDACSFLITQTPMCTRLNTAVPVSGGSDPGGPSSSRSASHVQSAWGRHSREAAAKM
jgi:hypothetical protein